jgi:hypothetical protein
LSDVTRNAPRLAVSSGRERLDAHITGAFNGRFRCRNSAEQERGQANDHE